MEFYMEDACIDRLIAPFFAQEREDPLLSEEIPCPYRPERSDRSAPKRAAGRRRKGGRA